MNFPPGSRKQRAFTLVEMLVVIGIIGILAALLLPALSKGEGRAKRVWCENNLQQAGLAFHIFMHDHDGRFPMQVSTNDGGALEFAQSGNLDDFIVRNFQAVSNELTAPQLLICPTDTRQPAPNFAALKSENVSYFVGVNADFDKPDSILSGDRNLSASGTQLRWTRELHQFKGNVLFADGHVEEWNNSTLASAAGGWPAVDMILPSGQSAGNPNSSGAGSSPMPGSSAGNANSPTTPAPNAPGNPSAQPRGNSLGSHATTQAGKISPAQTESQNLSGANQLVSITAIAPVGKVATSAETDLAMSTPDRHVVRFLQNFIEWGYLLLLLIFLLMLALELWRRKKQREANQISVASHQKPILDYES
jgi:prepilin-type N-terminal cleavage/methylation domain-containing protein/prepilin-type processing-associated H-X9-DG protein